MYVNFRLHLYLKTKGRGMDQKTSQYLVWPPLASYSATHLLRIELIRLLIGCGKLLDIGGNWNTLSYMSVLSIPNMLNGWHLWWVCRSWKNRHVQLPGIEYSSLRHGAVHYHAETWGIGDGWIDMTMGPRISSQYLCAFKLPIYSSVRCP